MKKMNKLTVAALAIVASSLASTAAFAQTVTTNPNGGDLVLGFQLASSPTDLEIDLGGISNLNLTSGAVTNLSSDLNVSDLTSTYGSTWTSNTNGTGVNWSVAGLDLNNTSKNAIYLTSVQLPSQVKDAKTSTLSTPNGNISDLTANGSATAGSLNGAAANAASPNASLIGTSGTPASSLSESYTSLEGGNGYGYGTVGANAEQTGTGTLSLFDIVGQASQTNLPLAAYLGYFTLGTSGSAATLTFTAASVPEPSAYALGICAALLFLVLRRRQNVA